MQIWLLRKTDNGHRWVNSNLAISDILALALTIRTALHFLTVSTATNQPSTHRVKGSIYLDVPLGYSESWGCPFCLALDRPSLLHQFH